MGHRLHTTPAAGRRRSRGRGQRTAGIAALLLASALPGCALQEGEDIAVARAPLSMHLCTLLGYQVIVGSEGDDLLVGSPGPDCIFGLGGNDVLRGRAGHDFLMGGPGDDNIHGGPGDDELHPGTGGADHLFGGAGSNQLLYGAAGPEHEETAPLAAGS
jgi:Ca2+-binding RTX toxin-like protein